MNKGISSSDQKILAAALNDGAAGWEALFKKYDPKILRLIRWRKWNFSKDEQNEIHQNIHIHLLKALPNFRQESSLFWYIKRITMNECVNEIRRRDRRRRGPISLAGEWGDWDVEDLYATDPHSSSCRIEQLSAVRNSMKGLDDTCRRSISMHYFEYLSYQEISRQLGISTQTVGSRLSKCREKLHQMLLHNPTFEEINL